MLTRQTSLRLILAAMVAAGLNHESAADTVTWTGGFQIGGPKWINSGGYGANWSSGVFPTANDDVVFPAAFIPFPIIGSNEPPEIRVGDRILLYGEPGWPPLVANSLTFLNSYKLLDIHDIFPNETNQAGMLKLTAGNITVASGVSALVDVPLSSVSGTVTKLGEGALQLGKTVSGNLVIQAGLLSGNFRVSGNLENRAVLSPGNSPGTIQVGGDYVQARNAKLYIELASPTSYDRIQAGHRAHLDGDLKVSLYGGYRPKRGEKFSIVETGDGVSGEFDDVEVPVWDNLTLRAYYVDKGVYLKSVINSFEALPSLTLNQFAVAGVLDAVIHERKAEKLINYLYSRDFDKLPKDLDAIAPEELTSIFNIGASLANVQSMNLQRRTDDLRSGASGFSASGLAMQGSGPAYSGSLLGVAGPTGKETKETAPVLDEKKWGVFLTGVGEWVDVSGDGNARGFDITTGGFTLGLDYKVSSNFAVGIAAGYAGTSADLTDGGRVWVNGGKLGLYATAFADGWYSDVAVTGGYNSYDTKRSALQGTARGSTDGGELNVLVGTGYDWKIGALTLGPTATFQYTLQSLDGFSEHGSLAPLSLGQHDAESLRTALGFKAAYDWKVGGLVVRPEIRAAWQHEYGDRSYDLDASFANGVGGDFRVSGPEIGRDSLLLGAGFAIQCNERISTYFYYDGEVARERYDRHGVSGGLRVAF